MGKQRRWLAGLMAVFGVVALYRTRLRPRMYTWGAGDDEIDRGSPKAAAARTRDLQKALQDSGIEVHQDGQCMALTAFLEHNPPPRTSTSKQ